MTCKFGKRSSLPASDVLIIGSGFSGSLLAMILARQGMSVTLIDRGKHPRFAIGESSTPIADLLLEKIAEHYDLPELRSLSRYGRWQSELPNVRCGLKRGFSFFRHHAGRAFESDERNTNQMLVTASASDDVADTHWYRADVDQLLVELACRRGVLFRQQCELVDLERESGHWSCRLRSRMDQEPELREVEETVPAAFIVDASGGGGAIAECLDLDDCSEQLLTRTSARFAHVTGLSPWETVLRGIDCDLRQHPFPCDAAAVHHVLDDGWLWMLRFNEGTTSVGRVWNRDKTSAFDVQDPFDLQKYSTLFEHVRSGQVAQPGIMPAGNGPSRVQRLIRPRTGEGWCLLPSTAFTLDPLFSTGIAMGIAGVVRVARALLASGCEKDDWIDSYASTIQSEIAMLDQFVGTAYQTMPFFDLFCSFSMLYFSAAIASEESLARGRDLDLEDALWLADDLEFKDLVRLQVGKIARLTKGGIPSEDRVREFTESLRRDLEPWNTAGLLNPEALGMYRYTGAAKN